MNLKMFSISYTNACTCSRRHRPYSTRLLCILRFICLRRPRRYTGLKDNDFPLQ